ncbi:MAG: VanZ family protein [Clostridia bacterium]|nr:VanZ family protein [Clostridia bacterium]
MFYYIYRFPLWSVPVIIAAAVILWAAAMIILRRISGGIRAVRIINACLAAVALGGIFYITLYHRYSGERELILMPFSSFAEAKEQREMYREMLMNVFLFVPLGLTLPSALPSRESKRFRSALLTAAAAAVLSFAVEAAQYFLAMGRAETDDILCNLLGAVLGMAAYIIFTLFTIPRAKAVKTPPGE